MDKNPTSLRVRDPGIRALFTIESGWQSWLDVEAALALAEAELGVVPEAAAKTIAAKARVDLLDRERIVEGLRRTGHQLVPIVWELSRICGEEAGRYVHWGATTQNVVQTRSEEHTSELQSLMRISYAVFCLKKKTNHKDERHPHSND